MTKEKTSSISADLPSLNSHFEVMSKLAAPFAKISTISHQAKKMSAANFRQLLHQEANAVRSDVDSALKEVDALLLERRSYNESLRRRIEFWNSASVKVRSASSRNQSEASMLSVSGRSQSTSQGEIHSISDLHASAGTLSGDSVATKASENVAPKMPSLADYDFSEASLFLLRNEERQPQDACSAMKPMHFEDDKYQAKGPWEGSNVGDRACLKMKQIVKPEPPQLLHYGKQPAAVVQVKNVEKPKVEEPPRKGNRSGTSLSGSFLDGQGAHLNDADLQRFAGPLIKGDLGFDDDSTVSSADTSTVPFLLMKQRGMLEESRKTRQSSVKKPPRPKLRTATFDSPY